MRHFRQLRRVSRLLLTGMVIGSLLIQPGQAGCWVRSSCAPPPCWVPIRACYVPCVEYSACDPCGVIVESVSSGCGCESTMVSESASAASGESTPTEASASEKPAVEQPAAGTGGGERSIVNKPADEATPPPVDEVADPAPALDPDDSILPVAPEELLTDEATEAVPATPVEPMPTDEGGLPGDDEAAAPADDAGMLDGFGEEAPADEAAPADDAGLFGGFGEEAPADEAAPEDDGGLFGGADDAAAPADDAGMFGGFGEEAPADEAAPEDDGGLFGGADDAAAPADDAGMFGEFGEEAPADQAAPADDGGLFGGADDAAAPADDAGMFGEFGEEAPADEAAPADDGGLFGGADDAAAPADDAGMFGEFGEEAPAEEAAPADDAAPAEDSGLFEGFDEQPADDGSLFDAIPEDAPGDEAAPATEPEDESSLFGAAEILGLPGGLASDEFRTWTDNTGLHKCQGRLLSAVDGHAKLLKANGRTSTVPFNRLSNDDISFVNRQVDASQHTLLQQTAQR